MFSPQDKTAVYRFVTVTAGAALILLACLLVLKPFIPALFLATIFSLAAWPGYLWLERKFGGRGGWAAFAMTMLLAVCFLVPLLFLGTSLADDVRGLFIKAVAGVRNLPVAPPDKITALPVVGPTLGDAWTRYGGDRQALAQEMWGYGGPIRIWLIGLGSSLGHGVIDVALGIVIAFFLFRHGKASVRLVNDLTGKFGGPGALHLLQVSKKTIIGVVYGIVGAAVVEGALLGIGAAIAHVPGAPFLGFVTLLVSIIPIGFPLVWLPVAGWLFFTGQIGWGIFMLVWGGVILMGVDFLMRPYFISSSSKLPLILVLLGVFGGIGAFGFLGLFAGPTLLAVAYVLIVELSKSDAIDPADMTAAGI